MTDPQPTATFRLMVKKDVEPVHLLAVPLHDVAVPLDDFDMPLVGAREDGGLYVVHGRNFAGDHHTSTLLWAVLWRRSIVRPTHGTLLQSAARDLVLPYGPQWKEAISTTLLGPWCDSLASTGHLPGTTVGALRAEARTRHRQAVPLWRRRTRHGRVLSLDADLGGIPLYEILGADVDLLAHTADGVFEDERLNRALRGLNSTERQVLFAYAEGEGTTWTEAATVTGAADPAAFGERVRRKAKRLGAEQARRALQRRTAAHLQDSLPVGAGPGTER
ncbi:hypothetical protein ACOB87_44150 [Streptomyces sp. YS-B37]|uniref:hypothetical protein n=1 Tax=Streptomyces sp. YS-B37 TaxID=3407669 RepID=UPI003B50E7BB